MIKIVTANEQNEKLERRKEKSNQMQAHDWHASKIENVGLGSEVLLNMISYSNEKYRANVEKVILHWAMKKKNSYYENSVIPIHTHTHTRTVPVSFVCDCLLAVAIYSFVRLQATAEYGNKECSRKLRNIHAVQRYELLRAPRRTAHSCACFVLSFH